MRTLFLFVAVIALMCVSLLAQADMVSVTAQTVDNDGQSLDGRVLQMEGGNPLKWESSPHTWAGEYADGGQANLQAEWGGLWLQISFTIVDSRTYWFDAKTWTLIRYENGTAGTGQCRVNIVFKPVSVTAHTINSNGIDLDATVLQMGGGNPYIWEPSPHTWTGEYADGGQAGLQAVWGGLWIQISPVFVDGRTYWFDAKTWTMIRYEDDKTKTGCIVNIVFKPVSVTAQTVNSAGENINATVLQMGGGNPYKWERSPHTWTGEYADGGQAGLQAEWGGIWIQVSPVFEDGRTYWFDAKTWTMIRFEDDKTKTGCIVNIVFNPISVTARTLDRARNNLNGTVLQMGGGNPYKWEPSPHTWTGEYADGGQAGLQAMWDGLWTQVSPVFEDGRTYWFDIKTGVMTYEDDDTKTGCIVNIVFPVIVNQNNQTINFGPVDNKTYGNADFTVSATASSGLRVTFTASGDCTVTPEGTVHITGAGNGVITAHQAGDDNFNAASDVSQAFMINKASLTITADNKTKLYMAENPSFTATYSGFVNGETESSLSGTLLFSTTATETSLVGSYPITPSGLTSNNYNITYVDGTLMIEFNGNSGILQPVNQDNTSVFKQGSTIPLKFRVYDNNNMSVGPSPDVVSSFILNVWSNGAVTDISATTNSTTPDTAFRWSTEDQQWIFNLNTKSLLKGSTYQGTIKLIDGSEIVFRFGLR